MIYLYPFEVSGKGPNDRYNYKVGQNAWLKLHGRVIGSCQLVIMNYEVQGEVHRME